MERNYSSAVGAFVLLLLVCVLLQNTPAQQSLLTGPWKTFQPSTLVGINYSSSLTLFSTPCKLKLSTLQASCGTSVVATAIAVDSEAACTAAKILATQVGSHEEHRAFTSQFKWVTSSQQCILSFTFPCTAPPGGYNVTLYCTWHCGYDNHTQMLILKPRAEHNNSTLSVQLVSSGAVNVSHSLIEFRVPATSHPRFVIMPLLLHRPPPSINGWDLLRVDVAAVLPQLPQVMVRSSPLVSPEWNTGFYSFSVALPPLAGSTFTMEIFLQQAGFNASLFQSQTCTMPRDSTSTVFSARITLTDVSVLHPIDNDLKQLKEPVLQNAIGWYEKTDGVLQPSTYKWNTESGFRYFTVDEARNCLSGRWLAFVGDSTMEELALATMLTVAGVSSFNEEWTIDSDCKDLKTARQFDTSRTRIGPESGMPSEARFTMFWAGASTNCGNLEGLSVWNNAKWFSRFAAAHAPDIGPHGIPRKPTIVFNSGLHDLAAPWFSGDTFAAYLMQRALPNLTALSASPLVIKTNNPKNGAYSCSGHTIRARMGEAAVQALNDLTVSAVGAVQRRFSEPPLVRVLNEHAYLRPLYEDSELFQHHCGEKVLRNIPRNASYFGSGCVTTAQALLQLICNI